jgi:hypothetical protein
LFMPIEKHLTRRHSLQNRRENLVIVHWRTYGHLRAQRVSRACAHAPPT